MTNYTSAKVFVDTNVFLYAFDADAGRKRVLGSQLVRELWVSGEACLSVQVLQEFYVNATRKMTRPLSPTMAQRVVSYLSTWTVHTPNTRDVLSAIELHQSKQLSFWDAMIVHSSVKLGCDTLYSEDLNAGQTIAGVKVVNPFEQV